MQFGLIGEHLPHSFSKDIHERLGEYEYELHEIAPEDLDAFMRARDFCGINVTIPYKLDVIPYLDEVEEAAAEIGAVNCVINRDGKLRGYNTDYAGMRALVERLGLDLAGKKVLICGTGGTSKTARTMASLMGAATVLRLSRRAGGDADVITYAEAAEQHADAQIIINTTPCGMFPNNGGKALEISAFPQVEGVVDAVYNPLETALVLDARAAGIPAEGGLYMLVAQAIYAAEYFLDRPLDKQAIIDDIFHDLETSKRNIVLVGMPGCGKTTVGQRLAKMCNRTMIDSDVVIRETTGMTPAEIIEAQGEPAFRDLESQVIAKLSQESGLIIATGGGAILRDENVRSLRQNGRIYFIDRPLDDIRPTGDRPLSNSTDKLLKLYDDRYPKYAACADSIIPVKGNPHKVATAIKERHFS